MPERFADCARKWSADRRGCPAQQLSHGATHGLRAARARRCLCRCATLGWRLHYRPFGDARPPA
eukprot:1026133-Alexandrium_andersonii.AAC.1